MKIRVIKKPPIESRHGVEIGDVYDAEPATEVKEQRGRRRYSFFGSVWIIAKGSGERVRLLASERLTLEDDET